MSSVGNFASIADEAMRILREAEEKKMPLRLMGGVAVRLHCAKFSGFLETMNRTYADMDFIGLKKKRSGTLKLLKGLGYQLDKEMLYLGGGRLKFQNASGGSDVEVFFDELLMNHRILLKDRLLLCYPTLSLADLLLQKLQIVNLDEKDIIDVIALLGEHSVADKGNDCETVDSEYISRILCNDWGFYTTAISNLVKIRKSLQSYPSLSQIDLEDLESKIDRLMETIQKTTKTIRWKMRATVGTRTKWYNQVEEVTTALGARV